MQRVYLDHAAGSPLVPQAWEAMAEIGVRPGNPSSLHAAGREARRHLEQARESLAESLGARPADVVWTSGGTEANNLAILGGLAGRAALSPERSQLVISGIEHPSVAAVRGLLPERVREIDTLPSGQVDLDHAARLIGPTTALVSVMTVNNETGIHQPVGEIAAIARAGGAWLHTDAVQAFGHLPLDFARSGVDAMTVTAHKLGGPVGIGALVVRREVALAPIGFGGGQERKLRSGTVPVVLAVGFAAAARVAVAQQAGEASRLGLLRDRLVAGALAIAGVKLNGHGPSSSAIVNLGFAGCRADDVLMLLDAEGIDAATGAACSAGVHQPSDVLLAMGSTLAEASGALRFSFGPSTSRADIDRLLGVLPQAVHRAR
ncbi:MAG: cysteine desulfurase family protein, partial [Micropruina sp.]